MLSHNKWSQKDYKFTQAGFGLVACMGMLAVILIAIVGLLPLVSSYARLALASKYKSQAKENARYGLSLALAELQIHLGPDERAATWLRNLNQGIEILDPTKQYGIGVWDLKKWDFSNPEANNSEKKNSEAKKNCFCKWLVSSASKSQQSSQQDEAEEELVKLAFDVELPELPDQKDTRFKSYYSYWVRDESLKIPFGFFEPSDLKADPNLYQSDEVSMLALGVASNPIEGGLKKNLKTICDPKKIDKPIDFWKAFSVIDEIDLKKSFNDDCDPFHKIRKFVALSKVRPENSKQKTFPSKAHKLYPIITHFEVSWGLDLEGPDDAKEVVLKYIVSVTLWNPYDVPLEKTDYLIKYAFEESVNKNFYIGLKNETDVIRTLTLNPQQRTTGKSSVTRPPIFTGTISSKFKEGAIKKFSLEGKCQKTNQNQLVKKWETDGFCFSKFSPSLTLSHKLDLTHPNNFKIFLPNTEALRNTFLEFLVKADRKNKYSTCQKILIKPLPFRRLENDLETIPIDITNEHARKHALLRCSLTLKHDCFTASNPFSTYIKPYKGICRSSNPTLSELIAKDFSHPIFNWSYSKLISIDSKDDQKSKYIPLHEATIDITKTFPVDRETKKSLLKIPIEINQLGTLCFVNFSFSDDQLYCPLGSSRCPNYLLEEKTTVVSSAPPSEQKIDIGFCLNHILWDNYFWPLSDDECKRFAIYESDSSQNDTLQAKDYFVKAPFNVNNTSVYAWKQLIQYCHNKEKIKWSENRNEEALNLCAQELVKEIKKRGSFMTVGAFVNRALMEGELGEKGALQAALDKVKSESERLEINKEALDSNKTPFHSLDARFYMALIGHNLTVRGDTFVVRANGLVKDPKTGKIQAEARCEVGVQRLPDVMCEARDDPNGEAKLPLSRKFRVIYFRWLQT